MSQRARRVRRSVVVAAFTIGGWLLLFGLPPAFTLDQRTLENYRTLANAEFFAGPAVGIAAVEPEESKAFRSLAGARRGGAFKYLLITGTSAGRLYGLAGVRHTNPIFFRVAVQPFRAWPGDVRTQFGCVTQSEPIREVVVTRGEHPVRLRQDESLVEWWKRRPPNTGVDLDIIGGGYTSMFMDFEELTRPAV